MVHLHVVESREIWFIGLSPVESVLELNFAALSASRSVCIARLYGSSNLHSKETKAVDSMEAELRKGHAHYNHLSQFLFD